MKKNNLIVILLLFIVGISLAACVSAQQKLETPPAPVLMGDAIHFFANGIANPDKDADLIEVQINGASYKLNRDETLSAYDYGTGEITVRFKRLGFNEYADSDWSQALTFTVGELDKPSDFATHADRIEWTGALGYYGKFEILADGKQIFTFVNYILASELMADDKIVGTYTVKVRSLELNDNGIFISPWDEYGYTVEQYDAPEIWAENGLVYWTGGHDGGYEVSVNGGEPEIYYSNSDNRLCFDNSAEMKYEIRCLSSGFFIDSEWEEFVLNRTKLDPVTNLRIVDGVVYWDSVLGATEYKVWVNIPSSEGFYSWADETQYPLYVTIVDYAILDIESISIQVSACPVETKYHLIADSDFVLTAELLIEYSLDTPVLSDLDTSESGYCTVYWSAVEGATEYYLVKSYLSTTSRHFTTDCFCRTDSDGKSTTRIVALAFYENKVTVSVSEEFYL